MSLKIWRSGCQHLNLFPGKVSLVANLPARASASVNARRPLCLPLSHSHLREYRNRRVNHETFDFLNSRLRSAFEGRISPYFTKRAHDARISVAINSPAKTVLGPLSIINYSDARDPCKKKKKRKCEKQELLATLLV